MAKHKKKVRKPTADEDGPGTPQAYRLLAGTFPYGGKVYRANQTVWSTTDLEGKHPGKFRHIPDAGPPPAPRPAQQPSPPPGVGASAPAHAQASIPGRVIRGGGALVRNVPQQTAAETPPPPPPPADEDAEAGGGGANKPHSHRGRGGR